LCVDLLSSAHALVNQISFWIGKNRLAFPLYYKWLFGNFMCIGSKELLLILLEYFIGSLNQAEYILVWELISPLYFFLSLDISFSCTYCNVRLDISTGAYSYLKKKNLAMVFGSIDISSSIDEGGSRVQSYMDVSCVLINCLKSCLHLLSCFLGVHEILKETCVVY
jgi:hypothetical protein